MGTPTFLSLTGTRNYTTNTLKSSEEGINFINELGRVKFVTPKTEEALVNNPEEGHALGVIS